MKMLKYYIGLAVLMLFVFGVAFYVAAMGGDAKDDRVTSEKAQKIAPALEGFISKNGRIPSRLEDIPNIGEIPNTISYTKVDATQYKFCLDYKTASNGFDGGWASLLTGSLANQQEAKDDTNGSTEYLDVYLLVYSHKKGQNCQAVKPYLPNNIYNDYCTTSPSSTYCRNLRPSTIDGNQNTTDYPTN